MKKTILFSLCLIALLNTGAKAQKRLELPLIPDSMKANAYSVIRENNMEFICESDVNGTHNEKFVLTVLNSNGTGASNFYYSDDTYHKLVKFTGSIYDAGGNLIREIKQSDLQTTEYSAELASDSKTYYYNCNVANYPYTVVYEWKVKYKTIIGFPTFFPQGSYNQSLEKASYRLVVPTNMEPLFKSKNMPGTPEKRTDEKSKTFEWKLSGLPSVEDELLSESLAEYVPILYSVPKYYTFEKTHGEMSSWNTFGKWQYSLLNGRDVLPETLKAKITELTQDCKTDKEKVRALYDYLSKSTRYVSIQLGIGGLQPMPAAEVNRTGFSDCKGLSNYMLAMLKSIGIPSVYTVVSTRDSRLLKDFASASQMNHVILQVPLPKDTLWLECTNPELPFGFIHSDIAGHDALLVKENESKLYQLPSYQDSLNKESMVVNISLNGEGGGNIHVAQNSNLFQYEAMSGFPKLDTEKQGEYLRRGIDLTQGNVSNISWKEYKTEKPSITVSYQLKYDNYGNKTGNRLFVPINIFRQKIKNLSTKKRVHPLLINNGFSDCDTIKLQIPDNYMVEAIPKTETIEQSFGHFYSSVKTDGR